LSKHNKMVDQSQHTDPADQSELIALFGSRGFVVTGGTKLSFSDRWGREVLQQCQICENKMFLKIQASRLFIRA